MVFKAAPDNTRWKGFGICVAIILVDLILFVVMLIRPVDWSKFILIVLLLLSIPLLGHLIYRTWSLFSLEYWVDRNAVTISWAGIRQSYPLYKVKQIIQGEVKDLSESQWHHWPARHLRSSETLSLRQLRLYATRPLHECLLLDMGDTIIAVSPERLEQFLQIIRERYEIGPAIDVVEDEQPAARIQRGWKFIAGLDVAALSLLLLGVVGVLVLFGVLMVRFPNLPSDLVMRYNADGTPELIRSKTRLFLLPAIGLMAWLINGIWGGFLAMRNQIIGAYMLWGGSIIVQVVSFFALVTLMS